jgi:hypothetical protein
MPAVPVNVELALVGVVIVPPVPDIMLHAPVPREGVLAPSVTVVNPQVGAPIWSAPALDVVGMPLNVMITSSVVAVHGPFEIVHLNV